MATLRRWRADAAVAVFMVVPFTKRAAHLPGSIRIGEPLDRELRSIFRCAGSGINGHIFIHHGVSLPSARAGCVLGVSLSSLDEQPVDRAAGDTELPGDSGRTHCGSQSPDLSGVDPSRTALIFSSFWPWRYRRAGVRA